MRCNHFGVLQQVYSHNVEQQWWPWTVTATAGRHHYDIHLFPITVPPNGGARSHTAIVFGLAINVTLWVCLLNAADAIAADVIAVEEIASDVQTSEIIAVKVITVKVIAAEGSVSEIKATEANAQQAAQKIESRFIPAVSTHFNSEVSGIVARSTIAQSSINPTSEWLNSIYQIPLQEDSVVDFLKMPIAPARNDAQMTRSIIKERIQTATTQTISAQKLVSSYTSLIAPGKEVTADSKVESRANNDLALQQARLIAQRMMASMPNIAAGSNHAFYLAISALLIALLLSLQPGLPRFTLLKVSPGIIKRESHVSQ